MLFFQSTAFGLGHGLGTVVFYQVAQGRVGKLPGLCRGAVARRAGQCALCGAEFCFTACGLSVVGRVWLCRRCDDHAAGAHYPTSARRPHLGCCPALRWRSFRRKMLSGRLCLDGCAMQLAATPCRSWSAWRSRSLQSRSSCYVSARQQTVTGQRAKIASHDRDVVASPGEQRSRVLVRQPAAILELVRSKSSNCSFIQPAPVKPA